MTRKLNTLRTLLFSALFLISMLAYSQTDQTLNIADNYLKSQSIALDLTQADISDYNVTDHYTSRHNGVTHIYFLQRHQGIEVIGALNNFNVLKDGRVMNMGNRFISHLATKVNTTQPVISPETAVKEVINHFNIETEKDLVLARQENEKVYVFKKEGIALEEIEVELKFQPTEKDEVRLVWQVFLYQRDALHAWNASVDTETGKVIAHYDNVIHCTFDHMHTDCAKEYRSMTKPVGPSVEKFDVERTNNSAPVVMEGTYNVLPLPVESPDHGSREIVTNPADPIASPYGWHDIDGVDGHEYTITRGNNVHAYQDIFNNNQTFGDEPDGGNDLIFDFPFDTANYFPYTMRDAAVTNLFYWNNIIHDVWYQYGFDEVSGNFQENNYGNGGLGGDPVRAEALDGSGTNNANFATRPDGDTSRMQMYYIGTGAPPDIFDTQFSINSPADLAGDYNMSIAEFGDPLTNSITGNLVQVDDGTGNPNDACEFLDNGDEIDGNIALIDRGNCDFDFQAWIAQFNGAIGVIICNDNGPAIFPMPAGGFGGQVMIPSVMVSQEDCDQIKMFLDQGIEVTLSSDAIVIPQGPEGRDSDFDNSVIIHEYVHGISNRLTGGPGMTGCLSTQQNPEQMGEGWSDWLALVMVVPEDWDRTKKGMGTYFRFQPVDGEGIRNYPYSTDANINPQTYKDINTTNIPHGVGEIWANILWDIYWRLIDLYGYDADLYYGSGGNNMAMQLVMDGMKLQPCNPTFIDGRDAIVRADSILNNGEHYCMIWDAFAIKGVGYSAQSGGNEAFDMPPACDPTLKMTFRGDETGTQGQPINYFVEIRNDIPDTDVDILFSDEEPAGMNYVPGSSTCGGDVNGDVFSYTIEPLGSGNLANCEYQLYADPFAYSTIEYEDGFDLGSSKWSKQSNLGTGIWLPNLNNPHGGTHAIKANNSDLPCDQLLTLKDALLLDGDNPGLVFWHFFNTDDGGDGGVVEISTDDGMTWEDLGPFMIDEPYNGTIQSDTINPLANRPGFTGFSKQYIRTIVDLTAFKDEMVKVRFRFGCNGALGGDGWYVDDVQFFDHVTVAFNEACMTSPSSDPICQEVSTIIFGDKTNTKEVFPQSLVKLYPNPTTGNVELSWDAQISEIALVKLISIAGHELDSWSVNPNVGNLSIDLSDFGKGVYMIQVMTDEAFTTKKVVVK